MKTKINNARMQIPCWLRFICMLLLTLMSTNANSQVATFGAPGVPGTTALTCGPIARTSSTSTEDFSQHYYLYTASDLASAGILPGSTITAIRWYKANTGATNAANLSSIWRVHMKNTSTLPSPVWCNPNYSIQSLGATLVYNNTAQVIPNTIGWINLTLTTPFVYTGGSLEVGSNWNCNLFTGAAPTTSGISWNLHNIPPPNQTFGARGTSGSLVMINESCSPISQIVFTSPTPTCPAPNPGLTFSTDTTACYGSTVTLSLQNSTPGTGVTYLWESADDIDFLTNVIPLSTSPTYTTIATTPQYYRCQVTCSNGPITGFSAPIFLNVYDPITVYAAGIDLTCHGDNLGEVYLSVSGGTAPYSFNWSNSATTQHITNLSAGNYGVIVTDANGCTASTSSTLIEPSPLNLNSNVSDASGPGIADGAILLNGIGGTPPYMFSIDGGVTYLPNNLFNGLLPTLYHCRIQDDQGCTTALDVTVNFSSFNFVDPSIFFEVTDDKDSVAHIVWGMPMPTGFPVFSVQIEGSDDGVNFLPIQSSPISVLPNAMTMPIGSIAPMNTLMFSNEMQPRFIYNEVVPNLSPNTTRFYRARLSDASGTLVVYTVTKQFLPPPVLYPAWPILNPMPCPPIGIVPPGYVPTPWLSTNQVGCCIVTKRLYMKFGCAVPQPCTDCVPACNCTTDPCCVHNCAQYLFCSCTPWLSCGTAVTAQWIVISTTQIPLAITATKTNVTCNGGSNGTITVSGPTQWCKRYKIIGAPACFTTNFPLPFPNAVGQVSNMFTGLCAGCYTVMVKDCYGCTGTTVVCITQPTAINLNATVVNTCTCTGSITVNATGGTPCPLIGGYTYQILPAGIPQSSNVFNNLCVGCYTIKVTDCNGCTKTIVKCVTNTAFNLHPIKVEPCFGSNNGSICISSSPLIGMLNNACLKYHIGATCTTTATSLFTTNPCFYNLTAGTYCIKIVDTCTGCDTCICVTLTNSTTPCGSTNNLVVNTGYDPVTGTKIIPNGVVDPLWTVTPTGGGAFGPVLTSAHPAWAVNANSHAIGWSGGSATGFRIFRRTFKMCSCDSITFNLNLAYDNWLNGIYIDGILVTVPNTITPFSQWGWTSNFTMFHNYTFTKYLCAGTHTIDVKVVNLGGPMGLNLFGSLTGTNNALVTNVSPVNCCCACVPPQVTPTVTNVSCNGGSNGFICINSLTPIPNPCLKYALVTSNCTLPTGAVYQTNPCFGGLNAGSYCIKVVDTCTGCDTCICVTITQPTPITLTATSVNTCACNGSITVTASGGTPCTFGTGYSYQIFPGGTTQVSPTFTGLCPGCYTIVVTDCNQCTASIVKCVIGGATPQVGAVLGHVSCNGGSDGSICILTPAPVNPCLKYKIGATCTSIFGTGTTNPCFTGLSAGNYCIKVTDTCTGCDTCICVTITQPPPILLTATSINTCACTGSITVNVVGAAICPITSYTYQIFPGGTTQVSPTFTGLCPGCYTIIVTDCNGCTASIVKCVVGVGSPTGLVPVVTNPLCNGGTGSICISSSVVPTNPCLKYALVTTNCILPAGAVYQNNPCFTGLLPGNYCIKIKDTCTNCDTCICVTITQPTPITLTATSVNTCACNGSITVSATGGTPCTFGTGYTYQIFPGGTTQASPTFTGLCPGCYTIVVRDCNNCTASIVKCVVGIGGTTGLVPVVTNPLCNGGTGSICINNTTGTINPCLKYALANVNCQVTAATAFQTNPCFTGLLPGNYCIKIKDTCTNCDTCICVTITQPTPITLTATSVNTCACNGSITVTATGGTPCTLGTGYTYQIFPGGTTQASPTFTGLCPGCYTIVVTDCNGCTASIVKCVVGVGGPTGLVPVVTNPLCNGGTGSICISSSVVPTNPCLKYALVSTNCILPAGAVYQNNPCFTGLLPGNYCIKIKDTCTNCDTCICVTITQPTPITLTATSVNTCACNGSITVSATGGTPCTFGTGYSYQIFPGGTTQVSPTFTGLCPGCYTIVVRDCNNCTASIVKCVIGGATPQVGAVLGHVSCNGGSDGSICILTPAPVNPCLKYKIGATCTSIFGTGTTNPCFTGLSAGNYCIKVTDTCTGCDTCICVTINQPPQMLLTATSINTCACTGSITVNVVGAAICPITSYTYQIFPGGTTQVSPTFTGLCPGCYTIIVTDCNGCTASIVKCVVGVGSPTGLVPVVTNPLCNGGTGSICISSSVVPTNPCLKYALVTTNCILPAGAVYQNNPCFTGLLPGNYCIKVKDTCTNCDTCICVTITQPTPITLTATSVNTCACNGSITVNATGGTPCTFGTGYSYQIFPGGTIQASPTFTGLCPGCYTIVVRDCNNCTASIVKCVVGVGSPTGLVPVVTNPLCNGGTGSICITNTLGVINPCLKYALVGTNCQLTAASVLQTNPCFTGLLPGNYCIKVKDTCTNCDTCICVTITQPTPITLTATSVNTCACNGSITVNATGGTPCTLGTGYTYQIFPGGTTQASPTFTGLCPGCYTIVVRDCNNCTASIVKCVVGVGGPTGLVPVVTNPLCNGGTGSICINNSGVTNPCLKYALATVNCQVTATTAFQTNPCFTGLSAGNYCIKIKDTCTNCDTCICVTITQPTPITLTATSVNTCACNGSITVSATGGTPCTFGTGYTYQIFPGGTIQASPTFTGLCPGCYTIVVRDCNNCTASIVKCVVGVGGPTGLVPVVTNPLCNGGTGSICISSSVVPTNPCLKYALVTTSCILPAGAVYQNNPCFTGLLPGNYCIKVKDTCTNCDTCICVTITQPTPITLTATSVNTCACNGSITVNATGGTPCTFGTGYTYQIFPGGTIQASPTFTGLCPGCYTIIVTDCNQCTASIVKCVVGIGGPTGLVPVVTNPLCNGGTGSICINNTTGTINPCLKYALANVNCQVTAAAAFQTNPCFTGLVPGNYCIKVKDTCTNCDTCICVTITQPTPITLTATSVNTCACNGSITVNATGGTPCTLGTGYSYQIFPGGTIQASPTFTGLCPGCYTIVVRDCNNCTASIVKCVAGVGGPTGLVPVVTNPLCNGGTGSICITNTLGVINPCLKYALVGTNCQLTAASVLQTNPCFTGLLPGNYCIKVKDTCTNCDTCICVTITQPTPITLTATSVNTCACNGSITVNATGGTPCTFGTGYSYQIFPGGTTQASPTFTGLCPGCYTIVVRDCNNCTASIVKCVVGVGGPTGLVPVVTNPLCNGGTGSICITNTLGVINPCLKYALVGTNCQLTAASVLQTNPCFTGLLPGNYCIKVKDTCTNCDTCICVTITQPAPITLIATSITACPCNSSITVNAIGGTPCPVPGGYTYQIFPGGLTQFSPTFTGLCQGCYTIVVTDCNGCTASTVKCVGPCGPNPLQLNIQAFIQGYYVGSNMMAPVKLNQGVSSNPNITDDVTVELHSALPPYITVATTNAVLLTNGHASCIFNGTSPGMYYIAVKHRNGIQTWSAGPIPMGTSTITNYDFTVSDAQAYGNNMIQVDPGVWAVFSGDVNQDENIDLTDFSLYEADASNFAFGYLPTDIDGDGSVDLLDAPILENNINSFIFAQHP